MFSRSFFPSGKLYKFLFIPVIVYAFATYKSPSIETDIPYNNPPLFIENAQEKINVSPYARPVNLRISKIGLDTQIESLGLDENHLMAIPEEGKSVSWFKYGPYPGEVGNSVIGGHFDTKAGPAVFYQLNNLEINDIIEVINETGTKHTFKINKKKVVQTSEFDVNEIYGPSQERNLILITCHGIYEEKNQTYNQRLILFSKLVE